LFCRDNAAVLNLADACLSLDHGVDEFFLGPRGRSCLTGRRRIVFTAGGAASMARASPDRSEGQGDRASRGKSVDGGDDVIQHCLAQLEFL
jgi:hypothetical protein